MISVCKNASHYHSICDFCEEAKIRAKKRIYFLIILLRSVNHPSLLSIDAAAFLGLALDNGKLNSHHTNRKERKKQNAKKKKKERRRNEERKKV